MKITLRNAMILLKKFIKCDAKRYPGIRADYYDEGTIIHKNGVVHCKMTNYYYFYTRKNKISTNCIIYRDGKKSVSISVKLEFYFLKIIFNTFKEEPSYIEVLHSEDYSNPFHDELSRFIINFLKKDSRKVLYDCAIDTYSYLREYFSVKQYKAV